MSFSTKTGLKFPNTNIELSTTVAVSVDKINVGSEIYANLLYFESENDLLNSKAFMGETVHFDKEDPDVQKFKNDVEKSLFQLLKKVNKID